MVPAILPAIWLCGHPGFPRCGISVAGRRSLVVSGRHEATWATAPMCRLAGLARFTVTVAVLGQGWELRGGGLVASPTEG